MTNNYRILTRHLADLFAELPEVEAVALSGSLSAGYDDTDKFIDPIDDLSDIDLYVYTHSDISIKVRTEIMERSGGARRASMGLNFWGPGDEWFDAETGIEVDMVYFDVRWMEDQIKRVVLHHQASMGYSTCLWYTVKHSQVFYDPNAWLEGLQVICQQPYPERLRQNIIAHNYPVLREIIPSYFFQIEKAVKRGDLVSVNHRLAGLLASYFDIIFAINHELHPGEKRLVEKAMESCDKLPDDLDKEINLLLVSPASAESDFLRRLKIMLDHLDYLLVEEGFSI